jgi:Zn-dependent protease with chaperone function
LPSGAIFITDELISDLDATDDEIAAVIAKEVGHAVHRHS